MKLTRLNELAQDGEIVRGKWKLNDHHELEYRHKKDQKEVKFKAALIAAESNALVVALTSKEKDHRIVTQTAKLTGTWRANDKNQLVFEIEKETGKKDILTFQGAWHVGESNEIIYSYQESRLKRRTRQIQTLTFKGHWDITEKNRLTYLLEGDTDSLFRFRGTFQSKSMLAKEGEIRYQIGVEVKGKRKLQTIILFGKWKLSRDLELSFELEYSDGRKQEIKFGAEYRIDQDHTVQANLVGKEGDSLGFELIFTEDFMEGDGHAFIRLKKSLEESALEAGFKIPW